MAVLATEYVDLDRRHAGVVPHAIIASILVHALLFVLSPPFSFKPYALEETDEVTLIEPPAEVIIPRVPKDPAPPKISIAVREKDVVSEDTFPGTSPPDFADLPVPPPPPVDNGPGFLAFEEPPELIRFVAPEYPALARRAGFEGWVKVIVLIGEDGTVLDARIAESEVSAAMDRAALEAARRCRFEPAKQRTKPVKARVVIPFQFRLN